MGEVNISQGFRLENTDETINYLNEEINWNELISKMHKKICATLNYIEYFLILASTITGCVSISAFGWYSYTNYEFGNYNKHLFINSRNNLVKCIV